MAKGQTKTNAMRILDSKKFHMKSIPMKAMMEKLMGFLWQKGRNRPQTGL